MPALYSQPAGTGHSLRIASTGSKFLKNLLTSVLHVLVNNSGATWGEPLAKYPDEAFTKLLTLNVQRVFTLTQKLLPMLEKGSKRDGVGRVINVSHLRSRGSKPTLRA